MIIFFPVQYTSNIFNIFEVHPDLLMEVFTTRNQVKNILRNLDTSKSTGVDDISAQILKECAEQL